MGSVLTLESDFLENREDEKTEPLKMNLVVPTVLTYNRSRDSVYSREIDVVSLTERRVTRGGTSSEG